MKTESKQEARKLQSALSSFALSATLLLHIDSSPTIGFGDSRRHGNCISHTCMRRARDFPSMHESILAIQPSDAGATHATRLDRMRRENVVGNKVSAICICLEVLTIRRLSRVIRAYQSTRSSRKSLTSIERPSRFTIPPSCYLKMTQFSNPEITGNKVLTQPADESPYALCVGIPFESHASGTASSLRRSSSQSLPNASNILRIDQSECWFNAC